MALQGSWSFNEGAGIVAVDTSGNNRSATNVPGWSFSGHTENALAVLGTGLGAQVAIPSEFNFYPTGTFMCWVWLDNLPGAGQQIFKAPRTGGSGSWAVSVSALGVLSCNGQGTITGPTLSTSTWYHIAIANDWDNGSGAQTASLYVNGVLVGTSAGWPVTTGTLYWGGQDQPLNGRIDDARWYDDKLSQATIQSLMNTPVAGILESSGTTRFAKASNGSWQPMRTQRIVGVPQINSAYGWQLTEAAAGLNRHGINGENLPVYTGPAKPAGGATIIGKKITKGLDLSNGNITIERCLVKPTDMTGMALVTFNFNTVQPGNGPVVIRDCTIDGSDLTQQQQGQSGGIQAYGTITGNLVKHFGSGIAVMGVGEYDDTIIEANVVTSLTAWGDPATDGNHSDGFTIRDYTNATVPTRQITVRNNLFDCRSGNDTGACLIQAQAGNINNVTLNGNLLKGGGYNFGLAQLNANTYSNIIVTNNRFEPINAFGPASRGNGVGFAAWTNNYINNPATVDNIGATVPAP
ncbi:MAG: LamG domain-containing protein [Acidobacteriota bacterium]